MATSDRRRGQRLAADGEHWHRWQMGDLERQRPASRSDSGRAEAADPQQQQAKAAALRAEAELARNQGYESGYAEGHAAGYRDGYAEGQAAANAAAALEFHKRVSLHLTPLAGLAESFRQALAQLDDETANQLVELALITGRQLAGESLAANPEHILSVVRELLEADHSLNGKSRLWLHPDDLTLVSAAIGDTLSASGWECCADHSLERGGCRVTSASGGLDASLGTQWKAILDQRRRRQPAAPDTADDSDTPTPADAADPDA
ncbi:flagellar assembly protein FliH [Salinicola endophyticus]|uniref:flagellar assembly protein FliH n=1 Tax=Salinicola endophyticus TaxID=1949083 RepID=UPI000DA208C3|nr:flagellar assembly protein FliH [Salinicola endophyticus]